MIVKGVKLIESDDFTDTYDNLDNDLEEFEAFDKGFYEINGHIENEHDLKEDEL